MVFAIQEKVLLLNMIQMTISISIEILNCFYTEYVGEKLLSPFINYTNMKNFILFQSLI